MYINLITIDLCPGQGGGGVDPSGTLDITSNGLYNVYSYASASVSVHPSISLSETYTSNGSYSISGEFNGGIVNVDVHPSTSLSETYTSNGSYNITGEFNGGIVNVDVHPSISLSETYTSNGSYSISGEFNGGEITIEVPAPQFITETLSVSSNGTYIPSVGVDGFSEVVVNVPQSVTGYTEKEITEGIQIVNLSNSASYVRSTAFTGNIMLKTVYLPNCTTVGNNAFDGCRNLETVYLPSCSYIGKYCFNDCKFSFISVSLNALIIDEFAFADCINLHYVDLTNCNQINRFAFRYCSTLESVYINYSSVTSIAVNVFQATNSTFKVYVPSSLISDYQAATNWSSISSQIFPIPE